MCQKTILQHCHIFKNGGSTIDSILTKNFGAKAILYDPPEGQFLLSDKIIDIVEQTGPEHVASISSHRVGLPAPRNDGRYRFIPLVMVREPLDRLCSMYTFYHRHRDKYINHECLLAKREPFKTFVEILLSSGLDSSFSNLQCQFFLANYTPQKHPSENNWPTIIENLSKTRCVGLLEMFDESMVIWEEYLQQFIPKIDLSYQMKNVSVGRQTTLKKRLESISEQLGNDLIAEFKKRNRFDYLLYEIVKSRIESSVAELPNFTERLSKFKRKLSIDNKQILAPYEEETIAGYTDYEENQRYSKIRINQETRKCMIDIIKYSSTTKSSLANIIGCGLFDNISYDNQYIVNHGQKIEIIIAIEAKSDINNPIVGFTVFDDKQQIVFAMNSLYSKEMISPFRANESRSFSFIFTLPPLNSGSYTITPAFASGTQEEHQILAYETDAILFFVPKIIEQRMPGYLYLNDFQTRTYNINN